MLQNSYTSTFPALGLIPGILNSGGNDLGARSGQAEARAHKTKRQGNVQTTRQGASQGQTVKTGLAPGDADRELLLRAHRNYGLDRDVPLPGVRHLAPRGDDL